MEGRTSDEWTSSVVIFSYTESDTSKYIGYIDSSDNLKHTMEYNSFCDNPDFSVKSYILTSGDAVYNNPIKIDTTFNGDNNTTADSIKDISMRNIEPFKESIMAQKEAYGLKSSDMFEKITLGDPIEYYSMPASLLKEHNDTITDDMLRGEGYIFPLKINDKNIGIAYVKYCDGKWKVDNISNGQLEDIILSIKNNSKGAKLIFDRQLSTFGVLDSNASHRYFVPIDNQDGIFSFKTNRDKVIEIKNLLNGIKSKVHIK